MDTDEDLREQDDDIQTEENDKLQFTPLSSRETYRLSRRIVLDWDSLAGLMDIAAEVRQNIQSNCMFTDNRAKAEKVLSIFNYKRGFSRRKLVEHLKEIKELDLIRPIMTGQWRTL